MPGIYKRIVEFGSKATKTAELNDPEISLEEDHVATWFAFTLAIVQHN